MKVYFMKVKLSLLIVAFELDIYLTQSDNTLNYINTKILFRNGHASKVSSPHHQI